MKTRVGDEVTIKATVLEVYEDGKIRTHSICEPGNIIGHVPKFRAGDLVKGGQDRSLVWRVVHVNDHVAWLVRQIGEDEANAFAGVDELELAFVIDIKPTA